jgi:phenylacetate-CoA ligase
LAYRDKNLAADLFGSHSILPSLLQYNPGTFYMEANQNGELLFTVKAGVPLVRYNIHDKGGIIDFDQMVSILKKHDIDILEKIKSYGYSKEDIWRLPFFYVFGRSDGTISVGGANIYPENIEAALYHPDAKVINTHKLTLEIDENMNTRPSILVELTNDTKPLNESDTVVLEQKLHDIFLDKMLQINQDFRDAHRVDSKSTDPKVKIYSFGQGPFAEDKEKIKRRYVLPSK